MIYWKALTIVTYIYLVWAFVDVLMVKIGVRSGRKVKHSQWEVSDGR